MFEKISNLGTNQYAICVERLFHGCFEDFSCVSTGLVLNEPEANLTGWSRNSWKFLSSVKEVQYIFDNLKNQIKQVLHVLGLYTQMSIFLQTH